MCQIHVNICKHYCVLKVSSMIKQTLQIQDWHYIIDIIAIHTVPRKNPQSNALAFYLLDPFRLFGAKQRVFALFLRVHTRGILRETNRIWGTVGYQFWETPYMAHIIPYHHIVVEHILKMQATWQRSAGLFGRCPFRRLGRLDSEVNELGLIFPHVNHRKPVGCG